LGQTVQDCRAWIAQKGLLWEYGSAICLDTEGNWSINLYWKPKKKEMRHDDGI